jgi:hypothetical protein
LLRIRASGDVKCGLNLESVPRLLENMTIEPKVEKFLTVISKGESTGIFLGLNTSSFVKFFERIAIRIQEAN